MTNSEVLMMLARANRVCGHKEYADLLEKAATVKAAEEIVSEQKGENNGR